MDRRTNEGGASAPSNVVRLPTAVRRQVRQFHNAGSRAARRELPRFPADRFINPHVRAKRAEAQLIAGMERTPALALALSMFFALADRDRLLASARLAMIGGPEAAQAMALIQQRTIGDQCSLDRALTLVRSGRL